MDGNFIHLMFMKDGEIITEPYIPQHGELEPDANGKYTILVAAHDSYSDLVDGETAHTYQIKDQVVKGQFDAVLVDYYVERESDAQQIEITADKFGGNYYLEASTLFRDQNGVDMPAEFIIPNCKIQSNFTFTMASSGDPSTFTFTMDAFPGYAICKPEKKTICDIQIIEGGSGAEDETLTCDCNPAAETPTFPQA
jgi:hypothetical protein